MLFRLLQQDILAYLSQKTLLLWKFDRRIHARLLHYELRGGERWDPLSITFMYFFLL